MSKKFYAVNRETGERWKPTRKSQFLVMYDSGYLAVVTDYGWDGASFQALDTKVWRVVHNFKDQEG